MQNMFLGETLGAVILGGNESFLKANYAVRNVEVMATGVESEDGVMISTNEKRGNSVKVLENVDHSAYYDTFANRLNDEKESAVVWSFEKQKQIWSHKTKWYSSSG